MRKIIKKMTEKIKSAVTGTAKKIDFFGEGTRNGSVNGTTNTGINDIPVNGSSESKPKVNGDGKEKVPFEIDGAKSDTSKKEKLDGSSPEKIEPPSTGNNKPEVNASEPNSKTKTKTDVNGSASKIPDPLVECKKNGTSIDNGSKAENESETEINGAATKVPENNAKVPRKKSIEKAAGTKAKSTKKAHSKGSASKKSDKMIGKEIEEAVMRFKQKEQEEIEKIAGEIDKYFTGSSDLMNSIFKKLYADIIKSDIFDDPIIGLRLAERTRSICFNNKDKTALSVAETLNEYNNLELNDKQMIFMLTWAVSFLRSILHTPDKLTTQFQFKLTI